MNWKKESFLTYDQEELERYLHCSEDILCRIVMDEYVPNENFILIKS